MPAMSGSVNCAHCGKEGIHIIDFHYLGSNQMFRCSQCGYKFQVFSILPEGYADFGFDNIEGGVAFKIRFKNGAFQQGFIENSNHDDIAQLMEAFRTQKLTQRILISGNGMKKNKLKTIWLGARSIPKMKMELYYSMLSVRKRI